MATQSSNLAWRIPWTEEPWDCKQSGKSEQLSLLHEVPGVAKSHRRRKRNGEGQGLGVGEGEDFLERLVGDGYTAVFMYLELLNCTLKYGYSGEFLCILYHD